LILHLGAHKTATTLLQKNLSANREALKRHSIYFPRMQELKSSAWIRYVTRGAGSADIARSDFREFVERAKDNQCDTIFISYEDFLGLTNIDRQNGIYTSSQNRLDSFLETISLHEAETDKMQIEISAIIYLRRQDYFIESCYVQEIQRGRMMPSFDVFFERIASASLSWKRVVECIEDALGPVLKIGIFEDAIAKGGAAYWRDFLSRAGLGYLVEDLPFQEQAKSNRSLSKKGVLLAQAIIPFVTPEEWRTLFRPFIQQRFNRDMGGEEPFVGLSESARKSLLSKYQIENQEFGFDP
jgi:hypothetical protein